MKAPLDVELDLERMLKLYSIGYGSVKIARELCVSHETVQIAIRKAAEETRKRNVEHVDAAFMQQDLGLQHAYARCMEAIERAAALDVFDKEAVKCLLLVMDRRARLLGLDKGKVQTGRDAYAWLAEASVADLEAECKKHGVVLPKPFGAVGHS